MGLALAAHEDPLTVLVAREIEAISDIDILVWAHGHTSQQSYGEDADFLQLVRSNPNNPNDVSRARHALKSFVARHFWDIDNASDAAKEIARGLFVRRLRAYLSDDSKPYDICGMVSAVERKYDFPPWLGDLFDSCDWLDPRATREQASHLQRAIERLLAQDAVRHTSHT
jgi:hypothetical protein